MIWRWRDMLAGPLVWTAHFFILYGIGEFGGNGTVSRLLVAALTLIALAALAILRRQMRGRPDDDGFHQWQHRLTQMLLLLSAIAILWQSLPALLSY